jgi:hypothetical protein
MEVLHGKSFHRNRHSERRIDGWSVIIRMITHLSTFSWKNEARIGSKGRNIPNSNHELVEGYDSHKEKMENKEASCPLTQKLDSHKKERQRMACVNTCLAYQDKYYWRPRVLIEYHDPTYHLEIQNYSSPWNEKRPWVG